jgi:hypothetical protein
MPPKQKLAADVSAQVGGHAPIVAVFGGALSWAVAGVAVRLSPCRKCAPLMRGRGAISTVTPRRKNVLFQESVTSGANWPPHWRTRMETHSLPPGSFFTNLLREDAGMSSTEFAVISALAVFFYLLLLLLVRFSN